MPSLCERMADADGFVIIIGNGKTIIETSPEFLEAIMRVNLMSHFLLIKEFLPGMLEAKKGHVVTLASMASFSAAPGLVDYCATKAGALALHEGTLFILSTSDSLHYCPHTPQIISKKCLPLVILFLTLLTRPPR